MPKLSRVKLTKRTVETASASGAVGDRDGVFLWDSEVRGFALRVYRSGKKVFLYQYQHPTENRTRRLVLGAFPSVTAEDARARAIAAAGLVASGTDPKGDDTDELQRRSMADAFALYLAERRGKNVKPSTMAEYERVWRVSLAPAFGTKRVSALTNEQVTTWHTSRSATPRLANVAVDLLGAFCTWAERRGYRPRHSNPCVDVTRYKEKRRSRSLSEAEYARLGSALSVAARVGLAPAPVLQAQSSGISSARKAKASGATRGPYKARAPYQLPASPILTPAHPSAVAALRFLVLTGWRENEAITLRWDVLDMTRGVAVLEDTKTGRSERPLGQAALGVLRRLTRVDGNPFVFVGEGEGRHVGDVKRVWLAVKHAARLEESAPLRLHDLRHSFTTVARDDMGLGDHVIARLVGHTVSGMTGKYGTVRDATVLHAANGISATIDQYLTGTETNVLPFLPRLAIA